MCPATSTSTTWTSPGTHSIPGATTSGGRAASPPAGRPRSTRTSPRIRATRVSSRCSTGSTTCSTTGTTLHEGDWENIQLIFDASDARQALERGPVSVGYSQHEGSERATWGEDKLELVDRTHPVVHPAAGSHANFFGSELYLGSSAQQGVGCDDTSSPSVDLRPVVRTIPSDPDEARARFPWIAFEGRWGEFQKAFFNGPTGPNLKTSWTEPISVSTNWRDRSYAVPAGGALGTGTTDFFCSAIAAGSNTLRRLVDDPLPDPAGARSAPRASWSSGSRARRGGRARRFGWPAVARGARSPRPQPGCTPDACRCSWASASSSCRSRSS